MYLIDSHCHLDILLDKKLYNIEKIIFLCKKYKIKYLLSISVNINNFINIFNKFSNFNFIFYSCGVHPNYINTINKKKFWYIEKFINYKKVIAIGETGLDYLNVNYELKKLQYYYFYHHLYYANKYNKPIIIHSRFAFNDTLNILKKFSILNFGVIIHSFSYGNKKKLYKFLNLGVYISLSGLITFKNFINLRNIIKYIPLDRLLVETDSPFLTPEPYRNKINTPYNIILILNLISKLKKIKYKNLVNNLYNNFLHLFEKNIF